MSLLKWSTPERQKLGQTLPIIPNEIYFYIFEYIAPPDERLTPEQLHVLTSLCGVCRLFANVCLPRVFEIVVFSGPVFHDSTSARVRDNTAYKTSHESVLCAQLEAKQPLALAIAKVVRVCHFTGWGLDKAESCAVRLLSRKYITGMSYMTNLRELRFSDTLVDERHWNAIINSSSLEELSFLCCLFRRSPADVQPRKWVKVPRLQVLCCGSGGVRLPLAAINAQYLRALDMDHKFLDQVDWHLLSSLTELRFHDHHGSLTGTEEQFMERLHAFLMQAPRSLEELRLAVDVGGVAHVPVRSMFDHPAWRNLSLLRSLTFVVESISSDLFSHILSSALEGVGLLGNLQSLTVTSYYVIREILTTTQIRDTIHDKLGPGSHLKRVDICGTILHLVDGEWLEVSSRTAHQVGLVYAQNTHISV